MAGATPIRSIKELKSLRGQRVLVRVDFNVPVKNGRVADDYKMKKNLPTIEYLIKKGARLILISHLGMLKATDPPQSLRPVSRHLEKLLHKPVRFIPFALGINPVLKPPALGNGDVALLENVRYAPDEKTNTGVFAKSLAALADIFVLDGFASAHRNSTSAAGVAKYLPAYAGLLLSAEISGLARVMRRPKKPLVIILGGAKAETKIPVLKNLLPQASAILASGGIVNTYLAAKGFKVGGSLVDKARVKEALIACRNRKVVLPVDFVVGRSDGSEARIVTFDKRFAIRNKRYAIYDVGPATVRLFAKHIKTARTLIFNGALGMFEVHPYEYATRAVTELFAARAKGRAFGVCGGGETVQMVRQLGLEDQVDLVSTGGGAMLEFLSGQKLPGIEALRRK